MKYIYNYIFTIIFYLFFSLLLFLFLINISYILRLLIYFCNALRIIIVYEMCKYVFN